MNQTIKLNEEEIDKYHKDIEVRALASGFANSKQIIHNTWKQKIIIEAFHIPNQKQNNQSHHFNLDLQSISIYRYCRDKKSDPFILHLHQNVQTENQLYKTLNIKGEAVKKLTEFLVAQQQLIGVKIDNHKLFTKSEAIIVTEKNKKEIIQKLLENSTEELWEELKKDQVLSLKFSRSRIQEEREKNLEEFREMFKNDQTSEKQWQTFFERCKWIFGFGLDYRFLGILQKEARIGKSELSGSGYVDTDFLLDDVNNFSVIVEMKKPTTSVFTNTEKEARTYQFTANFINAISQILSQKAVWQSEGYAINQNKKPFDHKCILIYGNSNEYKENQNKMNTFELFRRDSRNVEIITYDELFERAFYIVHQQKMQDDYLQK